MSLREAAEVGGFPPTEPAQSAKLVGLRYMTDTGAGFRRKRVGHGFVFHDVNGRVLKDPEQLQRIKRLAIPPAWTDVWICPHSNGHLQATGRDARGRKQHRYHPRWREVRDETKFTRMIAFGRALPAIRRKVHQHMKVPGLPRTKVLAAVVKLLEVSLIRVGNDEYARNNQSYGLTTLRDRHVVVAGKRMRFQFSGKSGKNHSIDIHDPHLAKIVKGCQELPGQEIFQYIDDGGKQQDVRSDDVNQYLREISGTDFTAKDFRTWSGTVLAAIALQEFERFDTQAQAKKNILRAVELVAERLGNTPSICRKCYVHPAVFDLYLEGSTLRSMRQRAQQRWNESLGRLRPEESVVLALLQNRLADTKNGSSLRRKLAASIKVRRK